MPKTPRVKTAPSILIRVSALLSPTDQIAALVYECRNAQNEKQFARFIREAYMGALGKQDFIREILRLEHKKMKETRAFLSRSSPFRDLDVSKTEFYRKMLGTPEGFEEFIDYLHRVKRPEYDVFDMYSRFYDFLTITPQEAKSRTGYEGKAGCRGDVEQTGRATRSNPNSACTWARERGRGRLLLNDARRTGAEFFL